MPDTPFDPARCPGSGISLVPPCEQMLRDPRVDDPPLPILGGAQADLTPFQSQIGYPPVQPQLVMTTPVACTTDAVGELAYNFTFDGCASTLSVPAFTAPIPVPANVVTVDVTHVAADVPGSGSATVSILDCVWTWAFAVSVPDGFPGVPGPQGLPGADGPGGSQGAQGPQGAQGFQGYAGLAGSVGAQGPQGAQGAQGSVGTQGSKGDQGFQGAQGSQGPRGAQGLTGTTGAQGPQGFQGPNTIVDCADMFWDGDYLEAIQSFYPNVGLYPSFSDVFGFIADFSTVDVADVESVVIHGVYPGSQWISFLDVPAYSGPVLVRGHIEIALALASGTSVPTVEFWQANVFAQIVSVDADGNPTPYTDSNGVTFTELTDYVPVVRGQIIKLPWTSGDFDDESPAVAGWHPELIIYDQSDWIVPFLATGDFTGAYPTANSDPVFSNGWSGQCIGTADLVKRLDVGSDPVRLAFRIRVFGFPDRVTYAAAWADYWFIQFGITPPPSPSTYDISPGVFVGHFGSGPTGLSYKKICEVQTNESLSVSPVKG